MSSSSYPLDPSSYHLLHEIGCGVSAIVYKAQCRPLNSSLVAIKSIDLDRTRATIEEVRREAKAMTLLSHPNILTAHCSFTVDSHLWVVMPFMAAGSLQSIISSCYPTGIPEKFIAIILKEILNALHYLHNQGHLHRDIKAGNILVDSDGAVKLADFGVSASIYDSTSIKSPSISLLNEMAGTPYWMAPEVIHSHVGYGFKADIWSFGITALELAHGRPPLSHLPISKSLVMRMTNRLGVNYDVDGDDMKCKKKCKEKREKPKKRFSKPFKDLIACCLDHDPAKRPSAERLLRHPFFKNCKSTDYLVKNILHGLPAVEERFKRNSIRIPPPTSPIIDSDDDDDDGEDQAVPVKNRRISGWNFNEHDFELDPIFPEEQDPSSVSSSACSLEGKADDENDRDKEGQVDGHRGEDEKMADHEGQEKDDKMDDQDADKTGGGDDVEGGSPQGSAPMMDLVKAEMVPNLVSLLESLTMETDMVMNVLRACGAGERGLLQNRNSYEGGQYDNRQREIELLQLVQDLQKTVNILTLQLDQEKKKNSDLEEEIDGLKQKVELENNQAPSDQDKKQS